MPLKTGMILLTALRDWRRNYKNNRVGAWRSLVAHLHGVQGVPSSNLGAPTNLFSYLQYQSCCDTPEAWLVGAAFV